LVKKYGLIVIVVLLLCVISLAVCLKGDDASDAASSIRYIEPVETAKTISTHGLEPTETATAPVDVVAGTPVAPSAEEEMKAETTATMLPANAAEETSSNESQDTPSEYGSSGVHEHIPDIVAGVNATCISTGLTEGSKCSICGKTLKKQETLPKVDHRFEDGKCVWCGLPEDGSDGLAGQTGNGIELPEDDA